MKSYGRKDKNSQDEKNFSNKPFKDFKRDISDKIVDKQDVKNKNDVKKSQGSYFENNFEKYLPTQSDKIEKMKICDSIGYNNVKYIPKLDLHDNIIKDARKKAQEFIKINYQNKTKIIEIVTGKGDGANGKETIRSNILYYLECEKKDGIVLKFDYGKYSDGSQNQGTLIIHLNCR